MADVAGHPLTACWVLLTQGDRLSELETAVRSIREVVPNPEILIVDNGGGGVSLDEVEVVSLGENIGVPAGRDLAVRSVDSEVIFFLDDDAQVVGHWPCQALERFAADDRLAVISMRLVDECNATARRHVPRIGNLGSERNGDVATFLGGACAVRTSAYRQVGGYWPELVYSHEELDLSWRLIDTGYRVEYEPNFVVFHPRTEISRHADGWWLTGRNRVWIARRNLPAVIVLVHTLVWLVLGALRAPGGTCRRAYLRGWRSGWGGRVCRRPINWQTVWWLTRLGRPPVV